MCACVSGFAVLSLGFCLCGSVSAALSLRFCLCYSVSVTLSLRLFRCCSASAAPCQEGEGRRPLVSPTSLCFLPVRESRESSVSSPKHIERNSCANLKSRYRFFSMVIVIHKRVGIVLQHCVFQGLGAYIYFVCCVCKSYSCISKHTCILIAL